MIKYIRFIKEHHKQVDQMKTLILELKARQKLLNERVRIMEDSAVSQHESLNSICRNMFETMGSNVK